MRIIGTIPHPKISISIFYINDKYQIKFEAGQMEQIFKISHADIEGIEGITALVDEEFLKNLMGHFNEMFLSFKGAKERHKNK